MESQARRTAEAAARTSYGRLVALLSARSRDIAAAEDALAEAFATALRVWPETGPPERPEAWLLTAARRTLSHQHRAAQVRQRAEVEIERIMEETAEAEPRDFPDERLKLMFVCAHPAIDPGVRTALMLQTVLGLDAEKIAAAFLVTPAAMSQRLVRAKAKIRDSGLAFERPPAAALPERLADVLTAIYAAFTAGWDALGGAEERTARLTDEAIWLGRVAERLLPQEPEAKGLLALMLYCEARGPARRDPAGGFVPLSEQDPARWSRDLIIEAEGLLAAAARAGRFGRFQCEAAIQSAHCLRAVSPVPAQAIVHLYDLLLAHAPSIGAHVARAAMLLEAGSATEALVALRRLDGAQVATYQPYWVALAATLAAAGEDKEGLAVARARALELTRDPEVRAFLERRWASNDDNRAVGGKLGAATTLGQAGTDPDLERDGHG